MLYYILKFLSMMWFESIWKTFPGWEKLGLVNSCGEYKLFDEVDGTKIDDDECFFVIWKKAGGVIVSKELRAAAQGEV